MINDTSCINIYFLLFGTILMTIYKLKVNCIFHITLNLTELKNKLGIG